MSSRISTARQPLGFIVQVTRRLAVLCDDLPFPQFDLPVDRFEQTALELRRGDPTQDAPESVLLGESKGQFQNLLQSFRFGLTVSLRISGTFGAAGDKAKANDDDVKIAPINERVRQIGKTLDFSKISSG